MLATECSWQLFRPRLTSVDERSARLPEGISEPGSWHCKRTGQDLDVFRSLRNAPLDSETP